MWNPDQPNGAEGSEPSSSMSSKQSALEMEIADLRAKLAPPSLEQATEELARCLRLVAIAGMGDTDRREWLLVAFDEVKGIPVCELAERCAHARKVADHPSKIVPAIFAAPVQSYASARWYRERLRELEAQYSNRDARRLTAANTNSFCTPEEAKKILESFGYQPAFDGEKRPDRGPARMPTEEELSEVAAQFNREHYGRQG